MSSLTKLRRLSEKCRQLQRVGQSHADAIAGKGKVFVGLPMPHERGFCCIADVGGYSAWFAWESGVAEMKVRIEDAIMDAQEAS